MLFTNILDSLMALAWCIIWPCIQYTAGVASMAGAWFIHWPVRGLYGPIHHYFKINETGITRESGTRVPDTVPGHFVPKTFRSQERIVPMGNFHSRDFKLPGTFVPGPFRSCSDYFMVALCIGRPYIFSSCDFYLSFFFFFLA